MSETETTPESSDAPQLPEESKPARRSRASRGRRGATSALESVAEESRASSGDAATESVAADAEARESSESAARSAMTAGDPTPDDPGAAESDATRETSSSAEESAPSAEPVAEGAEVAASESAESNAPATDVDPDADEPELPKLPDHEIDRAVEALLFASSEPLTPQRVAAVLMVTQRRVKTAIDRLREEYAATSRAFDIREIAGGLRLYTRSDFDDIVARLEKVKPPEKLSASALESLAIIAYRQPITRAEIDSIRGVQSGALLKSLTDRKLIRVVGRSEQPGRPLQYGTTKRFLDHFGLASIEDLPRVEDLKAP